MEINHFTKLKNLLWATDFSNDSLIALPYLKYVTERVSTRNHALYVLPKFSDWIYETAFFADDDLINAISDSRKKSIKKLESVAKKFEVSFKNNILEGLASEEVLKYSHTNKIDMIFIGRRGISEIEHFLIGSTTSRLIRNSNIPVLVVAKKKKSPKIKNILVPMDFNDLSMMELKNSISFAKKMGAKLYLAHISEFFNYKIPVFKKDDLINNINEKISQIANNMGFTIEEIIYDTGEPAKKIIEIASKRKMDLIIMATHQRKGIEKFFLGSITEKVLMHSDIPILILPPMSDAKSE